MPDKVQLSKETTKVITQELLETAIRDTEGPNTVTVMDFTIEPASKLGDNMASIVLRVKIVLDDEGKQSKRCFIVKTSQIKDDRKNMLLNAAVFRKEISAYCELLPAFVQMQKEQGVEPLTPSVPRFYYGRDDTSDSSGVVMLEDLTTKGYKTVVDKAKGHDLEHCKLAIQELAKWHALSLALKQRDEGAYKTRFEFAWIESQFGSAMSPIQGPAMKMGLKNLVTVVQNSKTCPTEMKMRVGKLLEMEEPLVIIKKTLEPVEPFAIICHGDAWGNNMMFQYETKEGTERAVDMKIIDLQLVRYALPTTDLSYFMYFNTSRDFRKNHLKELLKLYHKTFKEVLDHVKSPCPQFTMDVVEAMFKKTAIFGWLFSVTALPYIMAPPEVWAKLEQMKLEVFADEAGQKDLKSMFDATLVEKVNKKLIELVEDAIEMEII